MNSPPTPNTFSNAYVHSTHIETSILLAVKPPLEVLAPRISNPCSNITGIRVNLENPKFRDFHHQRNTAPCFQPRMAQRNHLPSSSSQLYQPNLAPTFQQNTVGRSPVFQCKYSRWYFINYYYDDSFFLSTHPPLYNSHIPHCNQYFQPINFDYPHPHAICHSICEFLKGSIYFYENTITYFTQ